MSKLDQLYNASYRGVPFLATEETTKKGQRLALHEYPNSNKRYAEPLGEIPNVFTLVCEIYGDDFVNDRVAFESFLNEGVVGELVHPIYGSVQVQPGEYTVSSNRREVGKSIFQIPFYVSENVVPVAVSPTADYTYSTSSDNIIAFIGSYYIEPVTAAQFTSILSQLRSALSSIESAFASLTEYIDEIRSSIYSIIQTATDFEDMLTNLYNSVLQLGLDARTLTEAWKSLIDVDARTEGETNTVERIRNETNVSLIDEQLKLFGLAGYLASSSEIEFKSSDEVESIVSFSNEKFSEYFETNIEREDIPSIANDPDVRSSMLDLKVVSKKIINENLSNIWNISEVNPGKISIALLSYKYYKSLDDIEDLISINESVNVANSNETVKVFTE